MRAQTRAFSLIELVFVIVLIGVISSIAVYKLNASAPYHACVRKISVNLEHFQLSLARTISENYYLAQSSQPNLEGIFASYALSGKCSLMLDSKNGVKILVASYGTLRETFTIQPIDLSVSPRISCKLKDSFCRDIKGRTKSQ